MTAAAIRSEYRREDDCYVAENLVNSTRPGAACLVIRDWQIKAGSVLRHSRRADHLASGRSAWSCMAGEGSVRPETTEITVPQSGSVAGQAAVIKMIFDKCEYARRSGRYADRKTGVINVQQPPEQQRRTAESASARYSEEDRRRNAAHRQTRRPGAAKSSAVKRSVSQSGQGQIAAQWAAGVQVASTLNMGANKIGE